ncbi:ATP-binding protein [Actinomadura sp. DC4]|uniref:ATP-binding protein n=1 Tax=Actinomadura sp. DC4 TaxID=3055069 RepID=UPI0025AF2439|nr:ATP-binding protein [Actinomadura sp. DC4]MDN3354669.1 ATP-binding protein [Actinomadura sp. DC4]
MEQHMLVAAVCFLAAVAFVIVILLVRQRRVTARLRSRVSVLEKGATLRDDELSHLVTTRLPALIQSLNGRQVDVPGPRHPRLAEIPYGRNLDQVTEMFAESGGRAKARADESAKATLKAMMRGVQSLANEQQLAISRMQALHDDPDVLEGLLKIDHMNAQLGRRAQASAVLCGSWPGLQRSASSLTDVVRGATSRIRDYLRVTVHSQVSDAVVSRAVEPVVLAVAELLDNAARHSQPNTPVEVNFQPAHNGMAIVIDDAGVAMNSEELKRASRLLSGQDAVDINRLGDPPQVGFAVIGVLAARYNFSVSVDTRSPYGGVRAVLFLPTVLLTRLDDRPKAGRATPQASVAEKIAPEAVSEAPAKAPPSLTAGGLPRRRRAAAGQADRPQPQTAGAEERPAPAPTGLDEPGRPARQTAAGLGAWQRGTQAGRATVPPDSEGKSQA